MESINYIQLLGNNSNKMFILLLLIISSLAVRQAVIFSGQNWIKTSAHTITILVLPIITYVITSVISNNIALSIGMIGALSIVRFRNPVKSPLELVVYFLMITAGIAASVNIKWLILLVLTSIVIFVGVQITNNIYKKITNKGLFNISFSESNSLPILEVILKSRNDALRKNTLLVSFTESEGQSIYRFASNSEKSLLDLAEDIRKSNKDAEVRFSTA